MPSVWVDKRTTSTGAKRYRVRYRLGGAESPALYGGTFHRHEDALYHRGVGGLRPTAMERTLALLKLETGIAGKRFTIPCNRQGVALTR